MFTEAQFTAWCQVHGLHDEAKQVIDTIRTSEPSRMVSSRRGNVIVQFVSAKMGRTITCESSTVEFVLVWEWECDLRIDEFWNSPPPIKLV